jgi:DNA polymerase delta subunit 4
MPPKRRSTGAAAKTSNQSTLAFHGASNKVTKPGARATNAKKNLLTESAIKDEDLEVVDVKVKVEEEAPTTVEAAIIEQTEQAQEPAQSTPEEDEARLVKPKQLQAYWKKQNTGSAPRYHQDHLSLEEKILRKFDTTGQFGVSGKRNHQTIQRANSIAIALCRYRAPQALETSAASWSSAPDRGSRGAPPGARQQG